MKQSLAFIALACYSLSAYADLFAVFREPDGSTKWQYVANTSAGLLIIALVIGLVFLIRAHRRAVRANRALRDIKATLEQRVKERTKVLAEREAYIASIVNSMPVMLIGLNQQLQITQWNKKAEEITGRPIQDVAGKNLWEAYAAITLTEAQVKSVLESGETMNIKHAQPGQYSFDITLYPLDKQGDTGIVILISDVTKQVNAENKLAERDKVSAMGELASAMVYDISLPINSIFARVSSARQELEAADLGAVKEFLLREVEEVRQSAQQATAIAQNLLELASSHKDSKQVEAIPPIMDHSITLASQLFKDPHGLDFKYINIRRNYADNLPAIPCYPAELAQVFVRLMRHAFYALNAKSWDEDNKPWINIEISEFYDSLWIKLAHNGKCLSEEEQLEIFQPFFAMNSHTGTSPVEQRLSYSYFIITHHHRGQMAITSDEKNGTCFNIQLALN